VQIAQASGTVAQFVRSLSRFRSQAAYGFVAGALLLLLYAGHELHWSFPFFGQDAATTGAATMSAIATPISASLRAAPGTRTVVSTASVEKLVENDSIALSDEDARTIGIVVAPAGAEPVRQAIEAHGVTAYNQDAVAKLSVRVPGHVWRVDKRVGEEVHRGDCLAIIDAVEVGEAKTALLQAVIEHELKTKLLERLQLVAAEVAARSLRQAEADAREAQLRVLSTQQKLVNLGFTVGPDDLRAGDDEELAQRVRLLGIPEAIRNQLGPTALTANLIPITAPFDGVVIERNVTIGELASPDEPQFVIADVSRMWIELEVSKEDAARVRLGQVVDFSADGSANVLSGRVDWISTKLDPATRTLQVRAEVANPPIDDAASGFGHERLLKANTFGIGQIVVRETPQAVVVPTAAVQFDDGGTFVFVRGDGVFRRRNVKVGVSREDDVEIVGGLSVGDQVATTGSHVLKAELVDRAAAD
jgi:multidrug efflux pump subunit AcrA (membrane-fusion protein)